MEYNRIVAVTGLPGLYEVVSSKSDGAIVRSLEDQTTKFVSSRIHNLSHLESMEIYTVRDNVSLADVFIAMKDDSQGMPDVKDNKAIKGYFEKVYPDMDFERVYTSDMKKMVKWFEVLQSNQVDFTKTQAAATEETEEEAGEETQKPKAKKAKATAEADAADTATAEAAPKKARKKKSEE